MNFLILPYLVFLSHTKHAHTTCTCPPHNYTHMPPTQLHTHAPHTTPPPPPPHTHLVGGFGDEFNMPPTQLYTHAPHTTTYTCPPHNYMHMPPHTTPPSSTHTHLVGGFGDEFNTSTLFFLATYTMLPSFLMVFTAVLSRRGGRPWQRVSVMAWERLQLSWER